MIALVIPSALVLLFLVKKLTVIGNIGNTQGVATAINPPKNAKIKKLKKLSVAGFDNGIAAVTSVFDNVSFFVSEAIFVEVSVVEITFSVFLTSVLFSIIVSLDVVIFKFFTSYSCS